MTKKRTKKYMGMNKYTFYNFDKCNHSKGLIGEYIDNLVIFKCEICGRIFAKGLINDDCNISQCDKIVCGHCESPCFCTELREGCFERMFNDGGTYYKNFIPVKRIEKWVEKKIDKCCEFYKKEDGILPGCTYIETRGAIYLSKYETKPCWCRKPYQPGCMSINTYRAMGNNI